MSRRIAIIGFAFRFPGTDRQRFWSDLHTCRNLISQVDGQRWPLATFLHPDKKHPGTSYTFAAGSLGDVVGFDAEFFGISPREAAFMDPQQRLLLEMAWETLENAGIPPTALRGSDTGVFIGLASTDYIFRFADDLAVVDASTATGNTASIAANRLSYFFDFRGPSLVVDTACSSSLTAFHLACRAILNGECQQAIAGGINLHLHPYGFIGFSKASMLSPRGKCQVFGADADGYVRSEGGGLFLLKDYQRARADGDPILAVVAHSVVNTDGRKSGLTVPSPAVQAALLERAYQEANIAPEEIDYLEAHGTGTAVGDPVETQAIGTALGQRRPKGLPLPIGSVKALLGHLETASGIAGLVKSLYCLQNREIPPQPPLTRLNPTIPFADLNLEVVTAARPLRSRGRLVIGVNSFGFGGANAHVILISPPQRRRRKPKSPLPAKQETPPLPLVFSAHNEAALKASAQQLAHWLEEHRDVSLYDMAHTALHRRDWLPQRALVWGRDGKEIARALADFHCGSEAAAVVQETALPQPRGPAFVFSGNGSQWFGMGRRLLEDAICRRAIEEVDRHFQPLAGFSLLEELEGRYGDRYQRTEYAQPALFAVQVAMTTWLRHHGIEPVAVCGHSVGEIAAAWASGALSLEDAVKVIHHRSRLQGQTWGQGGMTAVGLGKAATTDLLAQLDLEGVLDLAGINSSRGVTVAGETDALEQLEAVLAERGILYKRLPIDYAFHSQAMNGLEGDILEALADLQPRAASIPFHSTVTGACLDGETLTAAYWWRNIRQPVQFEAAARGLIAAGINYVIEIGPHPVLRGYLSDAFRDTETDGRVIATLERGDDRPQKLWQTLARTALIAGPQLLERFFPEPGEFVSLPNYPWQRESYWHPVTAESCGILACHPCHPLLGWPLKQQTSTWENVLDTQKYPVLADHVVGETAVFPAAGFVELALAAALAEGGEVAEIEDLEIRAPLLIAPHPAKKLRCQLDPEDGRFAILARTHAQEEDWTLHGIARIVPEPAPGSSLPPVPLPPSREPDFDHQRHLELTAAVGLEYGPTFQVVEHGWLEGDCLLARLRIPEAIATETGAYHLHPAFLDGAFQLIVQRLAQHIDETQGMAFLPVRIGRLRFYPGCGLPCLARATLSRRSPHSLTADFALFDAQGRLVVSATEVRFRSARLRRPPEEHLDFLGWQAIPKPLPQDPRPAPLLLDVVQSALADALKTNAAKSECRRYGEEIDLLLDALCSRWGLEALRQLTEGEAVLSLETLQQRHPQQSAYLEYLLAQAQADGIIGPSEEGLKIREDDDAISAGTIWKGLLAEYPEVFPILHAVGRVGLHLPALLRGQRTLAEILPEEANLSNLVRQMLGPATREQLLEALATTLEHGFAYLPTGARLRVLEINAGAPFLAPSLCARFDFDRGDYTFVSPESHDHQHRLRECFPALEIVDLDEAVAHAEMGAVEPLYAIAFVLLDFAQPESARKAVEYASRRLAAGGTLVLLGFHPPRWVDFVFQDSPLRPASYWQEQLATLGLQPCTPLETAPDTLAGPWFLLAQATEVDARPDGRLLSPTRHWLVVAEDDGPAARLASALRQRLSAHGDRASIADAGSGVHVQDMPVDGIIYLGGLGATSMEVQAHRCLTATALAGVCECLDPVPTLWLVTNGAAGHLLPRAVNRQEPSSDAILWGYGRSLRNEHPNLDLRLLDLQDLADVEVAARAIARELERTDDEREVLIGAGGERYALRLRRLPRPQASHAPNEETPELLRLAFSQPGQLRHLHWSPVPLPSLGEDEVEVEVKATGLNFRDVMYTLGLLSDEALEAGFAGPTLGLEFAGIVSRCGSRVEGLEPGDRVVGFAPASFATRVVTKALAVRPLPPGLSFEAAATIPTVFFTSYYALHHLAHLRTGERVLIHGAAGGVGIAAIQLAQWLGAEIHATAGSEEKRDFLRLLGVEHCYDSRSLAFADQILERTDGEGVDVVLNSLAGEAIRRNLRILKPFGRFLELGKRDFYENTRIGLRPFRNNLSYFGIDADQLLSARPDLTRRLFDEIMDLFQDGVLHPLPYRLFKADDVVDAFRTMQQARHIGKIVVSQRRAIRIRTTPPPEPSPLTLPAEAAYLVTGGLSGFGLKTADWLAAKGARHLVLISRSGVVSEEARTVIARLEDRGVQVLTRACDVTDAAAVETLLEEVAATLPPLRGIVHAAAVIDDALTANLDHDRLTRVLAPKVLGALHLHRLTLGIPLDFFILYSSATTLFGNPGQANYVAANTWLEAFAAWRRAQGLPALAIAWGAIDDVGFLARNPDIKEALQGRMGGSALHSETALNVLETLLQTEATEVGVMELDWRTLARFLPSQIIPQYRELAATASDREGEEGGEDLRRLLAELSAEELEAVVLEMLKKEVGQVLHMTPERIACDRPLQEMGLDSLMGMELIMALEARFGIRLPALALSETPTLNRLANRIISQLRGEHESEDPARYAAQLARQHGVEVSAEEAARLGDRIQRMKEVP